MWLVEYGVLISLILLCNIKSTLAKHKRQTSKIIYDVNLEEEKIITNLNYL